MCMPSSACTRLKSHAGTARSCRIRCLKQWIDSYGASKPLWRSLRGRLPASSFNFPLLNSLNQTTFSGINCRKPAHSQNVLVRTFLESVFNNRQREEAFLPTVIEAQLQANLPTLPLPHPL